MKSLRIFATSFIGLLVVAYFAISTPVTQQQARTFLDANPGYNGAQMWYNCGGTAADLKIVVSESPSCSSGSLSSLPSSYGSNVNISFDDVGGKKWKVDWKWSSYYCNPAVAGCNQPINSNSGSYTFTSAKSGQNASVTATPPNTCG